jgi:SAM-dependent methyltransferase
MVSKVKSQISETNNKIRILDLGCGYGRVSAEILKNYRNIKVVGVDLSSYYVSLFNKKLNPRGRGIVCDIRHLPFKDSYFDFVFMMVTLMYLENENEQKKAIREIFRVLKKNGKFLIIESNFYGHNMVTLGGLAEGLKQGRKEIIPANNFRPGSLKKMIEQGGGKVKSIEGIPVWTLSIPVLFFVNFINQGFARAILKFLWFLDIKLKRIYFPSLYISYEGNKK